MIPGVKAYTPDDHALDWTDFVRKWQDYTRQQLAHYQSGYALAQPALPQTCQTCAFDRICRIKDLEDG